MQEATKHYETKHNNYLMRSALDMFSGNPTKRALKFEGIPTLWANKSLRETCSVRKLSPRRNEEPSISRTGVSQVILKKDKTWNISTVVYYCETVRGTVPWYTNAEQYRETVPWYSAVIFYCATVPWYSAEIQCRDILLWNSTVVKLVHAQ